MFVEHWKMPNGHEGHGVMMDDSKLEEYKRHVQHMNRLYGEGTHWLIDEHGQRIAEKSGEDI